MIDPVLMGALFFSPFRGQEVFSFEYDKSWLKSPYAQSLGPDLGLFTGLQYARFSPRGLIAQKRVSVFNSPLQ